MRTRNLNRRQRRKTKNSKTEHMRLQDWGRSREGRVLPPSLPSFASVQDLFCGRCQDVVTLDVFGVLLREARAPPTGSGLLMTGITTK